MMGAKSLGSPKETALAEATLQEVRRLCPASGSAGGRRCDLFGADFSFIGGEYSKWLGGNFEKSRNHASGRVEITSNYGLIRGRSFFWKNPLTRHARGRHTDLVGGEGFWRRSPVAAEGDGGVSSENA